MQISLWKFSSEFGLVDLWRDFRVIITADAWGLNYCCENINAVYIADDQVGPFMHTD
jgi:hypothetical protein